MYSRPTVGIGAIENVRKNAGLGASRPTTAHSLNAFNRPETEFPLYSMYNLGRTLSNFPRNACYLVQTRPLISVLMFRDKMEV